MPIQVPRNCASRDCGDTAIEPIHTASRQLSIDTVDGRPLFAHHVTKRANIRVSTSNSCQKI